VKGAKLEEDDQARECFGLGTSLWRGPWVEGPGYVLGTFVGGDTRLHQDPVAQISSRNLEVPPCSPRCAILFDIG